MSLDDLLKDLRIDYIAKLPDKIVEIDAAIQANDPNAVQDVFHKLKGSGKTYGVPEISDLGRVIEFICQHHIEQLHWVIPVAIQLIEQIYQERSSDREYNLQANPNFTRLQQLTGKETP